LVPATTSPSIPQEIQRITDWATANNLKLNNSQVTGNDYSPPRRRKHFPYPTAVPNIERVDKMNDRDDQVLGCEGQDRRILRQLLSWTPAIMTPCYHAVRTSGDAVCGADWVQ